MNKNIPVRSIIAKNVRKYRKLNNLTQEKLAELEGELEALKSPKNRKKVVIRSGEAEKGKFE